MSIKHALVVDDSRSARLVLKRLLENHGLEVETAESAEIALEYLQTRWPDVIFMDHEMPGMNGLQAVKVIKNDPKTAMIPVMMYTAKEGELYVGQARALGAVDVLPKHVEPAELFNALERLGLVTDRRQKRGDGKASPVPGKDFQERRGVDGSPGIQLEGLVERMFSEQRDQLRNDILASQRAVARDIAQEVIEEQRAERARIEASREAALAAVEAVPQRTRATVSSSWMWLSLVLLLASPWLLWSNYRSTTEIHRLEQEVTDRAAVMESLMADAKARSQEQIDKLRERVATAGVQLYRMLGALEWALNKDNAIPYSQEALGGKRLAMIKDLLPRLDGLGFRGVLRLETHLGGFCLVGDEVQGYTLAGPELAVDQCTLTGYPLDDSLLVAGRQSLEFTNFLDSSALLEDGNIEMQIVHHDRENSRDILAYPRRGGDAADWNAAAARNNRLEITLLPDPEWPFPAP